MARQQASSKATGAKEPREGARIGAPRKPAHMKKVKASVSLQPENMAYLRAQAPGGIVSLLLDDIISKARIQHESKKPRAGAGRR